MHPHPALRLQPPQEAARLKAPPKPNLDAMEAADAAADDSMHFTGAAGRDACIGRCTGGAWGAHGGA